MCLPENKEADCSLQHLKKVVGVNICCYFFFQVLESIGFQFRLVRLSLCYLNRSLEPVVVFGCLGC